MLARAGAVSSPDLPSSSPALQPFQYVQARAEGNLSSNSKYLRRTVLFGLNWLAGPAKKFCGASIGSMLAYVSVHMFRWRCRTLENFSPLIFGASWPIEVSTTPKARQQRRPCRPQTSGTMTCSGPRRLIDASWQHRFVVKDL